MVTVAALVLAGLYADSPAESWLNSLMGATAKDAQALVQKDDEYFSSKDGKVILAMTGDPTQMVWVMPSELEGAKFDFRKALTGLGYDGAGATTHSMWKHDEKETPLIKSVPGVKEGWTTFVGEYDFLFVSPAIGDRFDQGRAALNEDQIRRGFAEFGTDTTWRGAIKAWGKAQHIELFEPDFYVVTWRGQGVVEEVGMNVDLAPKEGRDVVRDSLTEAAFVSEVGFTFRRGVADWQAAFRHLGLDPRGVEAHRDEDEEDMMFFEKVKGLPEGWLVYLQLLDGKPYYLSTFPGEGEEPRRK